MTGRHATKEMTKAEAKAMSKRFSDRMAYEKAKKSRKGMFDLQERNRKVSALLLAARDYAHAYDRSYDDPTINVSAKIEALMAAVKEVA